MKHFFILTFTLLIFTHTCLAAPLMRCRDRNTLKQFWSADSQVEIAQLFAGQATGPSTGPSGEPTTATWAQREAALSDCLTPRILSDLKDFYQADREGRTRSTFAVFTVNARGPDGGRGLHIVKELSVGDRTIWVNEEWPVRFGRLELPDEIRVRTRVFNTPSVLRGALNSDQDFISLRVRVAWNQHSNPQFFIETIFQDSPVAVHDSSYFLNQERVVRRAPISNVMCQACHSSPSPFAQRFGVPGQPTQHESIVQPGLFKLPFAETLGGQDLLHTWPTVSANADKDQVVKKLILIFGDPQAAKLPFQKMLTYLESAATDSNSILPRLAPDLKIEARFLSRRASVQVQDGVYSHGNHHYEDAVSAFEREHYGRGRDWVSTTESVELP